MVNWIKIKMKKDGIYVFHAVFLTSFSVYIKEVIKNYMKHINHIKPLIINHNNLTTE